jgi:hypothetical protein
MGDAFSQRHDYRQRREVRVREAAPEPLRAGLIAILHEMGVNYSTMRAVICPVVRAFPDPQNWSEIPNVRDEVAGLVQNCDWYRVYDIIEAFYAHLVGRGDYHRFSAAINNLFEEEGIGWQVVDGRVVTRGPNEFEHSVNQAVAALNQGGYETARAELEEARRDLSRRPEPDITGTVQHCMASLECIARVISGDQRATLGEIVDRYGAQMSIPRPLDEVIEKAWGYASEMARHLREGRVPTREEAELLLGLSAIIATYLLQKNALRNARI